MRRITLIIITVLLMISLVICGITLYNNSFPDDEISREIRRKMHNDVYYMFKEENGDITSYYYLLHKEKRETICALVKTVNASIENGSNKIEICINSKAPHGFETSIVLRNYSDLASENADLKGLQYLAVSYPYFSNRDIYKEPMNYVEINDIRIFEIDEKVQKIAEEEEINWYEVWPELEDMKILTSNE